MVFHFRNISASVIVLLAALIVVAGIALAAPEPPVITHAGDVQAEIPLAVPFDPVAPPRPPQGEIVHFTLEAKLARLEVAPGEFKEVWTFNESVPGPTLRVNQGDTVRFTLINKDPNMEHGLDFHAGQMDPGTYHRSIQPGESITFDFVARYPGVFFYHCSADPVIMHIANGMFGAVIVDPPGYVPTGKEYVLVQHEWYEDPTDLDQLLNANPVSLAFNGVPFQYMDAPLTAEPGEQIRFYVVNAGPNRFSAFHVIGGIFDKVLFDGNPANARYGSQTVTVPPGGALVADLVADTGTYPVLTHAMNDANKGALGLLRVGEPEVSHGESTASSSRHETDTPSTDVSAALDPSAAGTPPSPSDSVATATGSAGEQVLISGYAFKPKRLTIKVGTTVTWLNQDRTGHAVVHKMSHPSERLFDSTGERDGGEKRLFNRGESYSFTFTEPGIYEYTCSPHPYMSGTIIVEE